MKRFVRVRCLLLMGAALLTALPLMGQNEEDTSPPAFDVKGNVETYHAVRSSSPFDFMTSRTRVRGEFEKRFGQSLVEVSINAVYNAVRPSETGIRLREAFFEHRGEHWGIRAGRQFVIWGAADGVRITDLVSPLDLTEFLAQDYDDVRMPVNALRLSLFNETFKAEGIFVPTFEGYKLPTDRSNPWNIFAQAKAPNLTVTWNDKGSTPALKLANMEYGLRLSATLPGVDFSLAALHTWNKMPVITRQFLSPTEVQVVPRYYRMGFVGGDVAVPLGQFVLRGEAAFNIDKHFSYKGVGEQRGFNTLNWLTGVDWYGPNDWLASAQFSMENIFGYSDLIAQKRNTSLLTFQLSKKLLGATLELSDFTYIDLTGKGWFSRFTADYALSDQVRLIVGYDWLGASEGHDSLFANYKDNSEFWFKARYSF